MDGSVSAAIAVCPAASPRFLTARGAFVYSVRWGGGCTALLLADAESGDEIVADAL